MQTVAIKRILTITLLALATVARAEDGYPDRDFKFESSASRPEIEHYAEAFASRLVERVIDDPSKISTEHAHLLEFGREDATVRGLTGQKADWYANTYAHTLELLLVPRTPKTGPAEVLLGKPVFFYLNDVEREMELLKTGDDAAASAILNDIARCASLEYGTRIFVEDLNVREGIDQIHVSGNPQVLYVSVQDLRTGIKQ